MNIETTLEPIIMLLELLSCFQAVFQSQGYYAQKIKLCSAINIAGNIKFNSFKLYQHTKDFCAYHHIVQPLYHCISHCLIKQ